MIECDSGLDGGGRAAGPKLPYRPLGTEPPAGRGDASRTDPAGHWAAANPPLLERVLAGLKQVRSPGPDSWETAREG